MYKIDSFSVLFKFARQLSNFVLEYKIDLHVLDPVIKSAQSSTAVENLDADAEDELAEGACHCGYYWPSRLGSNSWFPIDPTQENKIHNSKAIDFYNIPVYLTD
ncbi:hypothetical protein NPIL_529481 [Nephila pilipes]|uniref:Uncharacterized protein n=1 Tax=Nephila pilipes TaxID=299642 RepID=A0A8X6QH75_NEPPI|nr:hypothetical protein NPIL_529481 [Nephila pilipes]